MAINTPVPMLALGNPQADLAGKVGMDRQLVVNTTNHALHVMDGVTPGGVALALDNRVVHKAGDWMSGTLRIGVIEEPHTELKNTGYEFHNAGGQFLDGGFHTSSGDGWRSAYIIARIRDAEDTKTYAGYCSVIVNNKGEGYVDFAGVAYPAARPNTSLANVGYVNSRLGTGASLTALATANPLDEGYVETIEIKREKAIATINARVQAALYSGFVYEIDDAEYRFGSSIFDQQNLADLAILALRNPDQTLALPCQDDGGEDIELEVPASVVLDVHQFWASYKQVALSEARGKKARLMKAATESAIEAILAE